MGQVSSPFIRAALDLREIVRAEFEDYRWAEYEKASEFCRGALLNARGRRAGIDSYSLFMGNRSRAYAYASEELREWWEKHPRPVFASFESQRVQLYFQTQ